MSSEVEALKSLLLHEWDPIGVSGCEGAEHEYDYYAVEVLRMLAEAADATTIGKYLDWVVTSRMLLQGNPDRNRDIAAKAIAIYGSGHS